MSRAKIRRIRRARARLAMAVLVQERGRPLDYIGLELLAWVIDMHWDRHERPPGCPLGRMIGGRS